jgi:enolase
MHRKILSLIITLSLIFQQTGFAQAATAELNLAGYFSRLASSLAPVPGAFRPPHIRFFSYDGIRDNLKVMLDKGDLREFKQGQLEAVTEELLNYFLIGVSLPNDTFWVNLRPDSADNIIDRELTGTDVGKIMLVTDLQLKKDTARFTSPQTPEGREYWNRIYKKAGELYGYENVTIPTLARPWIVPNEIIVRETKNSAYVYKATLKVMLEEDHLRDSPLRGQSLYSFKDPRAKALNDYSAQLMRELIIPKLTKEVNLSKNYATLRQVYYSLILSRWFKLRFTGKPGKYTSLINKKDLSNLTSREPWTKITYFNAYKKSFSEGEYKITEPVYTPTGQVIRTYFSGGMDFRPTVMPINGATVRSPIIPALNRAGLVDVPPIGLKDKTTEGLASSPLEVRKLSDLKAPITEKRIDSGIAAVDWNVPMDKGLITDSTRIVESLDSLVFALKDPNLSYLYLLTHLGRPKGTGYEADFTLAPMVEEAKRLLAQRGLGEVKVVLLPYELAQAQRVIADAKSANPGKKIIFVCENIRFYSAEQSKVGATRRAFEEQLIALTGKTAQELVYFNEAFSKSHRGEEASMELAWLIPEEQRAAGLQLAVEIDKVAAFQARVTGRLAAMAGGAKVADKIGPFSKMKKLDRLIIGGAFANPFLAARGTPIGQSKMPSSAGDVEKVAKGLKKISEAGIALILPDDFIVKGKTVPVDQIGDDETQVDIGPKTIEAIVAYIDALKEGDGLILNGGAGVFDRDWGSKAGTVAIVVAANRAAERGVNVFIAGGDITNALKITTEEMYKTDTSWRLSDSIISSTGGGSLLTALAEGVANLGPVRAVVKLNLRGALSTLSTAVASALPERMSLPTFATTQDETSIEDSDVNRRAALDLYRTQGIFVATPAPKVGDRAKVPYEYCIFPIVVLAQNIPAALREKLAAAKDAKATSVAVQEYLRGYFTSAGVNIVEKQERSSKLDVGKVMALAVDITSLIAIKAKDGSLFIHLPVWLKKGENAAIEELNVSMAGDLEKAKQAFAEYEQPPLAWPAQELAVTSHEAAIKGLAKYAPLFFADFSRGDFGRAGLLARMINTIDPAAIITDIDGITYDKVLGAFYSTKDMGEKAKIPGYDKNLERFLASINNLQQLSFVLYVLTTPRNDLARAGRVIAVPSRELQDAVIRFYARAYRYLLQLAQERFGDARFFEPLRAEIGIYAQRLNAELRDIYAVNVNGATNLAYYLKTQKGIDLTPAEKENLRLVYAHYANEGGVFAYDILQLAGLLSEENFVRAFRALKVEPKKVLPSQKPYEAFDGTGRIGRLALALRLANDVNAGEAGYLGRYAVRTRALKGQTAAEKFAAALGVAAEMFGDPVIRDSGLEIKGKGTLADLIAQKRLIFEAATTEVLPAKLDFQHPAPMPSVYAMNILLDRQKLGVIYYVDIEQFTAGAKAQGVTLDNIPRPAIVLDGEKEIYFGVLTDATPGGVEVGDQEVTAAHYQDPKAKILSGPSVWELLATDDLEFSSTKLGDAKEELARLKGLIQQVERSRLSTKQRTAPLIYLKAQIPKKLLLPLGSGVNFMGRYLHKLPFIKEDGAMFVTPTSCSTNGASYVNHALSAMFGGFGLDPLTVLGFTYHMYTSGDKKKAVFGDASPKSTGAAKGVAQHFRVNAYFSALRTATALTDGEIEILGGSMFDFLLQLPENVSTDLVRRYLERVGAEFPEVLRVFTEADQVDGRYRWQDTITGQRTGSIIYADYINQVFGNIFRMPVGYDNEMSFSFKMVEFIEQVYLLLQRQGQIGTLLQLAPLASTPVSSSPAAKADLLNISTITPSITKAGADTVRLNVALSGGAKGHFVVPAGTSTGEDEFPTVGVDKAMQNLARINEAVKVAGLRADQLTEIARIILAMDAKKLGAEAVLAYQMALAWAVARQKGLEPYEFIRELAPDLASRGVPKTRVQYNITNGGQHAANSLDIQEFTIVPTARTTLESNVMCDKVDLELGVIYRALGLKANPTDRGVGPMRGKEGGYKIEDLTIERLQQIYANAERYNISNLDIVALEKAGVGVHEFVLNCMIAAIKNAGYTPSTSKEPGTVALALDAAATSMLVEGYNNLYNYEGRRITPQELVGIYTGWVNKYPVESIEDGLGENDWEGWMDLVAAVGDKVLVITDDITVSQSGRLLKFIEYLKKRGFIGAEGKVTKKLGILIKLNQNGFLTTGINNPAEGYLGTLEVIRLAKQYGLEWVVSHRSNEAGPEENEVSIAELAAGTNAYALKSGDHVQAVRAVKEDRLAAIDARERTRAAASPVRPLTPDEEQLSSLRDELARVEARLKEHSSRGDYSSMAVAGLAGLKRNIVSTIAELERRQRQGTGSSPLTGTQDVGGIDFRDKAMQINYQPMGNFANLDFTLPTLSRKTLEHFDVEIEIAQIENMLERQILPSGERIKEILAAGVQKGELDEQLRERIMVLLVKMGMLEEKQCCTQECAPEFKEALVLVDLLS